MEDVKTLKAGEKLTVVVTQTGVISIEVAPLYLIEGRSVPVVVRWSFTPDDFVVERVGGDREV